MDPIMQPTQTQSEPAGTTRPKVFLSYSRQDLAFAEHLRDDLIANDFDAYLDKHDIAPGEPWQARLGNLIARSDAILFCMSPAAVGSEMCDWEVNEAERLGKRIVPIVAIDVAGTAVPPRLKRLNYIFLRDEAEFSANFSKILQSLKSDITWVREHTRLGEKASEWDLGGRPINRLLRGNDITAAETWAVRRPAHDQAPSELHIAFIEASRARAGLETKRARLRSRVITGASLAAAGIFAWLGAVMYVQWQDGLRTQSKYLADLAKKELANGDPTTATLLALEALPDERSKNVVQRLRPFDFNAELALNEASNAPQWSDKVLTGHKLAIYHATLSPDGRSLLTGSWDASAKLWDVATGALRKTLLLGGKANAVAFSPDGKTLLVASEDNTARLWAADTGEDRATVKHDGAVTAVAFSPDGKLLLTGSDDDTARLWDVATGELRATFRQDGGVEKVAFSPDGQTVLVGGGDAVVGQIFDLTTGTRRATLGKANSGSILSGVAFSPDGRWILTGQGFLIDAGVARIWDASTGKLRATLRHAKDVNAVAFSPDGRTVLTGCSDGTARLWETETGALRFTLQHTEAVQSVAYSADGAQLLTGSDDKTARLWDAATGLLRAKLTHQAAVTWVSFGRANDAVITASEDGTARLWSVAPGALRQILPHNDEVNAAAFSPDGLSVVTAAGSILNKPNDFRASLWDLGTRTVRTSLQLSWPIETIAFSPNGKMLLIGSSETAKLWDPNTRTELANYKHGGTVKAMAFSRDGKTVLTGAADNAARLWDADTGSLRRTLAEESWVASVALSPDGRLVLTASGRGASLWDAETGERLRRFEHLMIEAVAFSPDGQFVLTGARDEARLWIATTGERRATLSHPGLVKAVAFISDGRSLVTAGGADVRLWDTNTGALRATYSHGATATAVAFSPDGRHLLTGSWDQTARIWELPLPIQKFVEREQKRMTRCLTPAQRQAFHLSSLPPRWCHERHLWPYHETTEAPPLSTAERTLMAFDALGGTNVIRAAAHARDWLSRQLR